MDRIHKHQELHEHYDHHDWDVIKKFLKDADHAIIKLMEGGLHDGRGMGEMVNLAGLLELYNKACEYAGTKEKYHNPNNPNNVNVNDHNMNGNHINNEHHVYNEGEWPAGNPRRGSMNG